ncbi:MAG: lysozyme inhibitor LprI family protein [Novosphingobium sp.]
MRALAAPFVWLLLGAAGPANTPSFSCSGTLTPAEVAICADPELAAWDRAIAMFYPVQRKQNQIAIAQQKDWLARRDQCGTDKACLRQAFSDWPGFPAPAGFGAGFDRPARYDTAGLEIAPIGNGWYAFSANAIHMVLDRRGRFVTANEGSIDGVVQLTGGRGHYSAEPGDEYSCKIDFTRQPGGWKLDDNGQCGGVGVTLTGSYRPRMAKRK